jgi:RNA polymerase sigma-70 factor (family 1)
MPMIKSFYSHAEDSDLFLKVKQNDVKAFEELYNRYWPVLVNAAYKRLNSREKAEDIVQNIFIDLYQRRSVIELTTAISAYLKQALKFKVLNEYRSQLIKTKYQKELFFSNVCKNDFAETLDAKELEEKITGIVNELPEKCKQVFMLSRKENLSNKDISMALNISVSTVEKHITKALRTVRCAI